jgi:probable O-glycosylation ligase (exosortase A-associated)
MRDILVTAIILVWLLFIFRRSHYGAYLWAWLSYMNPHKQCWGFAMNMPFAYVTFLVTAFSMLISKEPKRIPWTRETILLVIFIIWMTFTTTQAFYSDLAWEQFNKVIKIQAGSFLTLMLINSKERLRIFVWVIAVSIGYYGIKGGIFTIVHGGVYRVQGPSSTFFEGNNEMGLVLIMTVPLIRYLHLTETRHWVKLGLAGAMYLMTIAAFGSQSRGALVAMAVMATMLWLKSRNKIMTGLLIGLSITAAVNIMPAEWFERMHSIKNYEQDQSALGRINAWHTAFNVAKSHITGGGFEMFRPATFRQYAPDPGNVHDVHSVYFEVMGEHGFPGFFMFMALMGLTWLKASSVIRACKRDPARKWASDLAAMIQVSIIGYAAGGAFLGLAYFDYYYHLIIMTVIVWTLVNKPDFYSAQATKSHNTGATPTPGAVTKQPNQLPPTPQTSPYRR